MIIMNEISKSYDKKTVLNKVSLEINDGDFVVITGKSGNGKTTLLNIMGKLETADSGTLIIDGKANFSHREKTLFYRYDAGFLFQNFALIDNETVFQNLKISVTYMKLTATEKRKKILDALSQVGLLQCENKKVYQLSGGEQQRVALARVILKKPRYIFADEPTGNLDTENRNLVFEQLISLHEQGRTVIMVTHDKELAQAACITKTLTL